MPDLDLAGRRVVVTGGTGFLGGYVVAALHERGADVVPLGSRDLDLREQSEVRRMYAEQRPELVVHLAAAVGGIGANVENPGRFLYENALMGLMLLEEGRQAELRKFVLLSTTCAYPRESPVPLVESSLWDGKPTPATGPYGIAKRMLHEACLTYEDQYGMDSAVLIPTNLYGPGDHFDGSGTHVMPAMIKRYVDAHLTGAPSVTNWGSGFATREFLHASDAAEGIVRACERTVGPDPINLGTGVETSIRELAHEIGLAVGYEGEVRWDSSQPEGQKRRYLDIGRARELLGFSPEVALRRGVEDTIAWYLDNRSGE